MDGTCNWGMRPFARFSFLSNFVVSDTRGHSAGHLVLGWDALCCLQIQIIPFLIFIVMKKILSSSPVVSSESTQSLMQDLRQIIDQARGRVASTANYELTMMYWHIGERINREVLGYKRAEYGKRIVATVWRQLSWSHFRIVISIKDELKREFYLTLAASERWSKRTLQEKIDGMLFERTAISGKPDEFIKQELSTLREDNVMNPDMVFKSPYFLEFTGLKGMYSEKSLEDSIVAHLEQFIIELGNGFSFVARQKRIIIDGEDFYLDLSLGSDPFGTSWNNLLSLPSIYRP